MSDSGSTVRTIDWRGVAPWNMLFRTASLAVGISIVPLASLGVFLSACWWWLGGAMLSLDSNEWRAHPAIWSIIESHESSGEPVVRGVDDGLLPVLSYFAGPAKALIQVEPKASLRSFAYLIWGGVGTLAIWSFIGGAICRIAVMRLGRDEHVGLKEALRFATRRFPALFASALYPLALLIPLALVGGLIGLLMRMDVGAALIAAIWGLGLAFSFMTAILLLGVFFGWPLMIATVAAEGTDSLDGLSRGFAYSFQRPVHYALYALLGGLLAMGAVWVASILATTVNDITWWSTSWGTGNQRAVELRALAIETGSTDLQPQFPDLKQGKDESLPLTAEKEAGDGPGVVLDAAGWMLGAWEKLIGMMLTGFRFAMFWCLVAGIYLLLRKDVDETEFEELFLDSVPSKPLPDLDAAVADAAATAASAASAEAIDKTKTAEVQTETPIASAPPDSPAALSPEPPSGPSTIADSEPDEVVRDE